MAKASDVLRCARSQIGVKESPAGSNCVRYNTDYYGRAVRGSAYPWCVVFQWWCVRAAGGADVCDGGGRGAGVVERGGE